jgi:hypothetical protein
MARLSLSRTLGLAALAGLLSTPGAQGESIHRSI